MPFFFLNYGLGMHCELHFGKRFFKKSPEMMRFENKMVGFWYSMNCIKNENLK